MKKQSKYDEMFDKMREVLIEYATAKDEQGRLLHKTPEIMRKFGFGDDPKVIDGFNRWLNRQDIYRCPKPKRSERLHIDVETVDTLTPAIEALEEKTAELFPPEPEVLPGLDEDVSLRTVLEMNQAMWAMKSALDELCAAFDTLCDKYNAMTGQEEINE